MNKQVLLVGAATDQMAAIIAAEQARTVATKMPSSLGKTDALTLTRFLTDGETFQMSDGSLIDPDRVTISTDQTTYMLAGADEMERKLEQAQTPTTDFDGLPNRLSIDRSSPHHTSCGAYVGVKIDGVEVPNCIEFCVSEGWVRLGNPANARVTQDEITKAPKQYGKVEVWWKAKPSRQVRRQMARLAR